VIEMKKQTENLDPRPVDHLFGKAWSFSKRCL
jgi:hypothetical protein